MDIGGAYGVYHKQNMGVPQHGGYKGRRYKGNNQFFGGRAATLAIEELIILVFVTWLQFNSLAVKLAAQVIVVLLNYVFSKLWIFKSN